jgi:hypothetical protein
MSERAGNIRNWGFESPIQSIYCTKFFSNYSSIVLLFDQCHKTSGGFERKLAIAPLMVESANAAILGVTWRASTGNYTSDDKSLVSLAHIDERRIKRNVRKNRYNYYLDRGKKQ